MNRGDVWLVDFDFGLHPAVVVSRQVSLAVRTTATVALVTTQVRHGPAEVPLDREVGVTHPSVANCDELHTVRKTALVEKIGALRFEEMLEIDHALRISLDLI